MPVDKPQAVAVHLARARVHRPSKIDRTQLRGRIRWRRAVNRGQVGRGRAGWKGGGERESPNDDNPY